MNELIIYLISLTSFGFGGEGCKGDVEGYTEYYKDTGRYHISICDYEGFESTFFYQDTIYHELGHVYRHGVLSQKDKEKWGKVHEYNQFVSEYAKVSEVEDFCESFSELYMDKETKYKKALYIKKLIGKTKL